MWILSLFSMDWGAKEMRLSERRTNLEVLDAETMLIHTRFILLQAKFRSIISFYLLHKAVGDLHTLFKYSK